MMPTPAPEPDHAYLQQSLRELDGRHDQLVEFFYANLFSRRPETRQMFPADMTAQHDRIIGALKAIAMHFGNPDAMLSMLSAWGRSHARLNLTLIDYDDVGGALITALDGMLGEKWTPEMHQAWVRAYTFAAGLMLAASASAATDGPRHAMHI